MAERAGAIARVAPIVGDDRGETERALTAALEGSDVLVTVGGVSVGDHDHVRPALEAIGVALDFWKVAMKPGKPILLGRRGRARVIGLPGNPASAMVTFALFGLPLLRAMQGDEVPMPACRRVRCAATFQRTEAGRTEFVRGRLSVAADGDTWLTPVTNQASGAASSMAVADALLRIPSETTAIAKGELCDAWSLEELGA
jgi:molybdopterin molybdotransferase